MTKIPPSPLYRCAVVAILLGCGAVRADLDKSRYITLDEIRPGMEATALTVWYGTEIEEFPFKVLSIVRNQRPGSDMILAIGTDERFERAGAIQGCSGSPVYIDGRLAGALAAGWSSSLEPLYLIRPIEDMLEVGTASTAAASGGGASVIQPGEVLDLSVIYQRAKQLLARPLSSESMLLPLATSLPAEVCRSLAGDFEMLGLRPLPAGMTASGAGQIGDVPIEPGSVMAAVMSGGDINLAAIGTATEVVGQTVYGFGHSFIGIGDVEFPMSAGYVHHIVSTRANAFKLASPGPVVGTIQFDQNAAVRGTVGVMPTQIPMSITVERFNDPQTRTYNCQLAYDRRFTPMIAQMIAGAAVLMQGDLPPEHAIYYSGKISIEGGEPIVFENRSSDRDAGDLRMEVMGSLSMLLNNPFEVIRPTGIELHVRVEPHNLTAELWSAQLSQTTVKPGQTITCEVTLQSFRAERTTHTLELTIPENLAPGKYPMHLLGAQQYASFLMQQAPQRFRVVDAESLLVGLNMVLNAPRDRLHAVMSVPATGLTLRRHALPDLPPTRMMVLQDSKRLQPLEPYRNWVESSTAIDRIVSGAVQIELTVEKP